VKVLLASDSYPPLVGGATLFTHALAHRLAERGHGVQVITAAQTGAPAVEEESSGVRVHRLKALTFRVPGASADPYRNTPPPWPDPELVLGAVRVVRRFNPDVVMTYGWLTPSVCLALARRPTPMVVSVHDYGNVCAVRTLMRHGRRCSGPGVRKCVGCASSFYGAPKGVASVAGVLGSRPLLRRRGDALHTNSGHVLEVMRRHLLGRTTVPAEVIPVFGAPGAAMTGGSAAPDPEVLARLPREPFILFVGALRQIKGIVELLAAYQRLVDPPPLVLLGARAPDSPVSFPAGVTVVEGASHATVMAAWDRALFGVAPSLLAEPFGIVVQEAMSRGRPVIGSAGSGHEDLVTGGETGLLVEPGDVEGLARAMGTLAADGVLRERLGAAARERAEAFSAERAIGRYERLLQRAVAAGHRR